MNTKIKRALKVCLGVALVLGLLVGNTQGLSATAWAAQPVPLSANEQIVNPPTGGISPFYEITLTEEGTSDEEPLVILPSTISPKGYTAPVIPGGTRYGYDWISNSANTGTDSTKLAAIYEGLVRYSDAAYQKKGKYPSFKYAGKRYFYAGKMGTKAINLSLDVSGGNVNYNGAKSRKSLELIKLAWAAFARDNPQYYMFENGWFIWGDAKSKRISAFTPVVSKQYSTYAERQHINMVIEEKYKEYADAAALVTNSFEKARMVHDKMLAERDYAYRNGKPDASPPAHNILGVMDLSTRGPVCESYAEAFAYILNRLGIETLTIFGNTGENWIPKKSGGGHAWNLVKINGLYYYADPTWDEWETVGITSGAYNDPGNLKNQLYHKYFLVGTNNPSFLSSHFAGTPQGNNIYHQPGLPPVNPGDFNLMSSPNWLTDNGFFNDAWAYGANYNYYIGYSNNRGDPAWNDPNAIFLSGDKFNGWRIRDFGTNTVASATTNIAVSGALWRWTYTRSGSTWYSRFSNPQPIPQSGNYDIVVEKPYKSGKNRAYIYGKGTYRGIDFGIVNLIFPAEAVKTQSKLYLVKGKTVTLPAALQPYNTTNKGVTWESGNKKIATVTAKGKVKGIKAGKTTITVHTKDGDKMATCTVYVVKKAKALKKLTISPGKATSLLIGESRQVKATLSPTKATGIVPTFKSSKSRVAVIDKAGVITALTPGKTTITVKAGKKTKKFVLTVK